jgi:methylene-tetrahydrofolate reductase-like protein
MLALRLWSVRHAGLMERLYRAFEPAFLALDPLWRRIGHDRLERPVARVEQAVKGLFFDCQMCGRCVLSSTGMSCPMNCPKTLRNGPCGGVRPDGRCEVKPEMPCVWVKAWEGSRLMKNGGAIGDVQVPVDHAIKGTSAWLRLAREHAPAAAPKPKAA